jgi:hypothetical protein
MFLLNLRYSKKNKVRPVVINKALQLGIKSVSPPPNLGTPANSGLTGKIEKTDLQKIKSLKVKYPTLDKLKNLNQEEKKELMGLNAFHVFNEFGLEYQNELSKYVTLFVPLTLQQAFGFTNTPTPYGNK